MVQFLGKDWEVAEHEIVEGWDQTKKKPLFLATFNILINNGTFKILHPLGSSCP